MRHDGRSSDQMRAVTIVTGVNPYAEGSVEVSFGNTKLLITASVEQDVPRWMKSNTNADGKPSSGWVTGEYGMLPRATHTRNQREAGLGKLGGRTQEIQRLIGRSLRAAVDLKAIAGLTIRLDCDVLVADGGTRTAAISGGWTALAQAIRWAETQGLINSPVALEPISAVSVGMVSGKPLLDLCYEEDSQADFDLNLVFTGAEEIIEIQGTGEKAGLPLTGLEQLIALGLKGSAIIRSAQQDALPK